MHLKTVVKFLEFGISDLIQLLNITYYIAVHETPLTGEPFLKLTKEANTMTLPDCT
jgi:hypothetical protein